MGKIFLYLLTVLLFLPVFSFLTYAQCSDAGACQLSHLIGSNEQDFDLSFSYKNGFSGKEEDVTFHSINLNAQYNLFEGSKVGFLIPYNITSGPLGDVNGIGDLLLSWTQNLLSDETSSLSATIGARLATGDENKEPNLPQIYQPGLGTNDLIFTLDYNYESFGIGAGYQLAGGRNDLESTRLKRGDDLLLRSSYHFTVGYFQIIPQLIFIKRLSKSSILDQSTQVENFIEVEGSDQSQLNFLAVIQYNLNDSYAFVGEIAVPFIKRDVNVDGLTRTYTASIGFKISY